jgi:amidophosphoribosyltransferase
VEGFRDESGLFGVAGHVRAAELVRVGLSALRHRGDQGAGLVASDGFVLRAWRGLGDVGEVFGGPQLQGLVGRHALGQVVRIAHAESAPLGDPAAGPAPDVPLLARVRGGRIAVAMAGRFTNGPRLRRELEEKGAVLTTASDAEILLHLVGQSGQRTAVNRLVDALWRVEGAFALLVLTEDRLVAVRDPRGIRPLVLGRLEGATVAATEDAAIRAVGGEVLRVVEPGEMVIVDPTATRSVAPFRRQPRTPCIHEGVSLARTDAQVAGRAIYPLRVGLGERLAADQPAPRGQVVVGLPEDGVPAALGFARASKLPFEDALARAGSTFTAVPFLSGRRVVLVAASLVTGVDVGRAAAALRAAGAAEVHVRVAAAPVRMPCSYGVTGPTADEIVQVDTGSLVALTQRLGADSLAFLSIEAQREAAAGKGGPTGFCDACFSGNWPIAPETDGQLPLFEGDAGTEARPAEDQADKPPSTTKT